MPKMLNIELNTRFNSLTFKGKIGYGLARFECDCGNIKEAKLTDVVKNKVKSCGCQTNNYRKTTLLITYGVDNVSKIEKVKAAKLNTFKEKYGVSNAGQIKSVREKVAATNLERYGHTTPLKNEQVKAKIKATNLTKYGKDNPAKTSLVKDKLRKSNLANGQATLLSNGLTINQYLELHGLPFLSHAYVIRNEYGDDALYDWVKSYKTSSSSLEAFFKPTALDLGLEPYNKIPDLLKDSYKYRPDFKSGKVCVDLDGLLYHSSKFKADNKYHLTKRKAYEESGLRLYQFRQDEVLNKLDVVKSILNNALGKSHRLYARHTLIAKVSPNKAKDFMNTNHLMGSLHHNQAYGLYYEGELVSLMSVTKRGSDLHISRFTHKLNTSVVGGLGKLIKHVIELYRPLQVVSFVDLRYGTGDGLIKLGFSLAGTTLGFSWTDGYNVFNRLKCTKLNEAKARGWYKLYDAGQAKFVLKIKSPHPVKDEG